MSADDDALLARRVDKIVAITDPETVEPTQAALVASDPAPGSASVASPNLRPVQLGLMEGSDRAVGPMLGSVVHGNNSDLMHQVSSLYLTGSVLDVTYGRGMWWQRFQPEPFGHHDLALDGVDFRHLPHADRSWDTVCFDPPYVPRQGGSDATMGRDQDFRDRFGLADSRGGLELQALIADGLAECARVMNRWLLVKCNDYTNGRQFHLGHVRVLEASIRAGLRCHDLIVHASGTGPGGGQIREVKRARRAHSYLLVLERTGRTVRAQAGEQRG